MTPRHMDNPGPCSLWKGPSLLATAEAQILWLSWLFPASEPGKLVGFAYLLPADDTRPEEHIPGALPNIIEHV